MRFAQVTTGLSVVVLSWYGMLAVHEAGHCLGAWAGGATVDAVVIPPIGFSRTDFSGGSRPWLAVAGGPLLGAALPLLLLLGLPRRFSGGRIRHAVQFFVGFCLLTNGIYIGLDAFLKVADGAHLVRLGIPEWMLVVFGLTATGAGLVVWHRMGPLDRWFAGATADRAAQMPDCG